MMSPCTHISGPLPSRLQSNPKFFQIPDHPQGFGDPRGAAHGHGYLEGLKNFAFRGPGIQRALGLR